jgi:hypothetical protein
MRMRIVVTAAVVSFASFGQDANVEPHVAFMTKFEEAVKADNYAQMKDLVIKNKPNVQRGFFLFEAEYCSAVSNKSEEDLKHRINILEKLSTLASQEFKDRSLADRIAWMKTLTPEMCVKKIEFDGLEYEGEQTFRQAEKSGDKGQYKAAIEKFEKAYPLTVAIGDPYWRVNMNIWLASAYNGMGEIYETAYHYKRGIELARELKQMNQMTEFDAPGKLKKLAGMNNLRDDLIDVTIAVAESKKKYAETVERLAAEALNPGGAAGAESKPGGAAPAPGTKGMPAGLPPPANKHTARIEWVDAEKSKPKEAVGRTVPTANVHANGPWLNWYGTQVSPSAPSKQTVLPGDNLFKNDKGKLLLDPDGAGKAPEERLKVQEGKAEVVLFKARTYQDGTKADIRHRLMEEPRAFSLNGMNLSFKSGTPGETPLNLRWQGATAVTTKFEGYEITVYDDSANGDFSTYGDDSMTISKAGVVKSIPLSRYVYLGDLLYEMKIEPNGQNVRFKPYDGPIALLEFKYVATTMPAFMILEGLNENAQFYVNLMECKDKPMWVPPGEYKFRDGYFMFGEGEKRETISVKNTRCNAFKVAEGKLNLCEMGGAKPPGFTYAWKAELEKDKGKTMIRVPGKHIQVFGCGGEEYYFFMSGVFRPHVKIRSSKDGTPFFDKQMRAPAREDLDDNKPWGDIAFFPKDIEAEKTTSGDVFVQLEGEYPKLGKITSTPQQVQ